MPRGVVADTVDEVEQRDAFAAGYGHAAVEVGAFVRGDHFERVVAPLEELIDELRRHGVGQATHLLLIPGVDVVDGVDLRLRGLARRRAEADLQALFVRGHVREDALVRPAFRVAVRRVVPGVIGDGVDGAQEPLLRADEPAQLVLDLRQELQAARRPVDRQGAADVVGVLAVVVAEPEPVFDGEVVLGAHRHGVGKYLLVPLVEAERHRDAGVVCLEKHLTQVLMCPAAALVDDRLVAAADVEEARCIGDELLVEDAGVDQPGARWRQIADEVGDQVLDRPIAVGDAAVPLFRRKCVDDAEELAVGVFEVDDGVLRGAETHGYGAWGLVTRRMIRRAWWEGKRGARGAKVVVRSSLESLRTSGMER